MKGSLATGVIAAVASVVSAGLAASPVGLEARQATSSGSASVPVVTVRGNAFYRGNDRFYIRGLDYQPGGASDAQDPIANIDVCRRDLEYFRQLGINTIRVYTIDNTLNHDTCMNELAAAGIYVALDVNTPLYSINRADPAPSYNPTYLQSVFATMDVFSKYNNTLLFFNGNEVINDPQTSNTAPYVKAVGRDMKQYRISRGLRPVPIGYSAADVEENRYESALYFNCGPDDQRSDFFAFNDYSWCDPDEYAGSEWERKVEQYRNYSLPLFLSEYGCVQNERVFGEVAPLYNEMTPVYSGGLVYEYTEEGNLYGIVSVSGSRVTTENDFDDLAREFRENPAPQGDGGARLDAGQANACPAVSEDWNLEAFPGELLPSLPEGAERFFRDGAGRGPGLAGTGSLNAGGESRATASPGSGSATTGGAAATSSGAAVGLRPVSMGYGALVTVGSVFVGSLVGAALL
ncbi:1,3-beta-glucanosyltransferase gel1 [Elsinoe ampelina]|uniref:1,3-beta-glucanosyltransferase n=1 Tax=Elsinoe ampelina TaxID=302913 RepID=A0A6A6G9J1_9PEZI|nr:1,3-beta-glucanosyltransferase gel1 [Elsinoe ampelina]